MKFFQVKSVEETFSLIKEQIQPITEYINIPLFEALHFVVAEDIYASENVPDFRRSTVDGYAVKAKDTFGSSESFPGFLTLAGEVQMGQLPPGVLQTAEVMYVPTGGMLPEGSDAVIMIEHCEDMDGLINVFRQVAPGENVISVGEDMQKGALLLRKGTKLRSQELGALASQGITEVTVIRKPIIGYLSSGDEIVPIETEFALALAQFTEVYGEPPHSLTEQNIQARLRGRLLMEYSNQTGALVLSTGNKSELSVGYTTLYGDMTGGFNLIGDLYKTDVYRLCEYFNQLHAKTPIPANILSKAPSAELAPAQKDSDTLPEYSILDPILKLYIEGDLLPQEEQIQYQAMIAKLDPSIIARVHKMVDNAEFKRRQASPIVRLQRRAFGFGRQLPITATFPTLDWQKH